ncbi:fatty acyl-CoA reductase wat-like [Culicoides brevitarsis]|uniref:fatty acyl-CoA reductase wat-like n=1 Tax=Culicoides brevitarsis TaxID=469753 RepID=UPI00307BA62B
MMTQNVNNLTQNQQLTSTPIKEFYKNKNIFLTGATGFIGQSLVEKILRCCEINKLFILIRDKKGKSWQQRIDDICRDPLFDTIKKSNPSFNKKIFCVSGDISKENLGISPEEYQILCQEVNIVLHVAATVKFNEKLATALNINVRGTQNVIALCHKISNLCAFVHVSTAFSNCNRTEIREKVYEPKMDMPNIMNYVNDEVLNSAERAFLDDFRNSYVFSKNIAEAVANKTAQNLPTVIFRPAIVMPSYSDPVTGWTNSMYGPIGVLYGAAKGGVRVFMMNGQSPCEFVPVDMCVSAILACAWDIAMTKHQRTEIPVYNFVPKKSNKITYKNYIDISLTATDKIPLKNTAWYTTFTIASNYHLAKTLHFLYHIIPAFFVDFVMLVMRKKFRLMPIYEKIDLMMKHLPYFYFNEWIWHDNNVSELWSKLDTNDRKWLFFDMGQVNWYKYITESLFGMRWFLAHEDESTIPVALKKQKKLKVLHYTVVFTIQGLILYFVWLIMTKIYFREF